MVAHLECPDTQIPPGHILPLRLHDVNVRIYERRRAVAPIPR